MVCARSADGSRFLKDSLTLADQGIKATTKILLLKVIAHRCSFFNTLQQQGAVEAKIHAEEDAAKKLNTTLAVAEELASRKEEDEDDSRYYFELTNQKVRCLW